MLVPLVMSPQVVPSDAQRCHWYVNEVGLFDHVPSNAVKVDPSFGVPLIVGGAVFCGVAAAAAAAKMPTAASANITVRARFRPKCHAQPLFRVRLLSQATRIPPAEVLTRRGQSFYRVLTPQLGVYPGEKRTDFLEP